MERTRIARLATTLAVAALVAACGQAGGGPTVAPATAGPTTSLPTAAGTSAATLILEVETAPVGDYVAGKDGKALYIFTKDTGNTSACTGECEANWPPLGAAIGGVAGGAGVTGALATITRADGSLQVTLGGHPLYYFGGDTAAGQTNGQALNQVWYLAAPDGKGIGAPAGGRDY